MAMKAVGLFGGVQMVNIVCSLVRNKLVAMWIGPAGVGLFGLFNNALETLTTAVGLGVRNSSVRDLSQCCDPATSHRGRAALMIAVVRRWSLWLAVAGVVVTVALAPLLSKWTFGSDDHVWGFIALSIAVLMVTLTNGELAVLQGTGRLRRFARVSLWGTVGGLLISVPLFYWLRSDSIVPSIVAYAACGALAALVMRSKEYPTVNVTTRQAVTVGTGFIKLGLFMTAGVFVAQLAAYAFNAWLNVNASTEQVGFYQAGYTLINRYTGLILAALGMEYYPRLSRVAQHATRLRVYVSQEINIAMAVMAPVVCVFVVLREFVVWLLYTPEFFVIEHMVTWGMVGTIFRTLSWCIAFVILAKGSGKIYLVTETLSAIVGFALNVMGYRWGGITGLGVAFAVWYIVYTIIVAVVYLRVYRLTLSRGCWLAALWTLAISLAVVAAMNAGITWLAWLLTVAATLIALYLLRAYWRA